MKKLVIVGMLIAALFGVVFAFMGTSGADTEKSAYLRVHIRANSNSEEDQAVKYKVRDAVVEFLTPVVAECGRKDEAISAITKKLPEAEKVAERVLEENGYNYGARASIRKEEFPTRVYESVTLEAGVYDALILELGTGTGDNWWCVVYPPLCFTSGNGNIIYKSKIAEIVRKFFADHE